MKNREREDFGTGWLLQYENVAWFSMEDFILRILDRRVYPQKCEFIKCEKVEEVVCAIKEMAVQSGGQFAAGLEGMVLASRQFATLPRNEYVLKMEEACKALTNARVTTKEEMAKFTLPQLNLFHSLIEKDASSLEITKALKENSIKLNNARYRQNTKAGEDFAKIVKDGEGVLTHCFGETCFAGFLRSFNEEKKNVRIYCQETRPFLQGARLTASLSKSLGFQTTLITDAMAASLMSLGKIDYFVSASDVITQDFHVVNKVGTLNTAIVASYFGLPYYAIGSISEKHKSVNDVKIEMRDENEVLHFLGMKIAEDGVGALYPSFDITPPKLVSGIFTFEGFIKVNGAKKDD